MRNRLYTNNWSNWFQLALFHIGQTQIPFAVCYLNYFHGICRDLQTPHFKHQYHLVLLHHAAQPHRWLVPFQATSSHKLPQPTRVLGLCPWLIKALYQGLVWAPWALLSHPAQLRHLHNSCQQLLLQLLHLPFRQLIHQKFRVMFSWFIQLTECWLVFYGIIENPIIGLLYHSCIPRAQQNFVWNLFRTCTGTAWHNLTSCFFKCFLQRLNRLEIFVSFNYATYLAILKTYSFPIVIVVYQAL